jgi:hypothetical protein
MISMIITQNPVTIATIGNRESDYVVIYIFRIIENAQRRP